MNHSCLSRRLFLGGTIGGFFSYALSRGAGRALAQEARRGGKRVVVLWMNGGPSWIDTFDPKPGQETGGEFKGIPTNVKGLRISEVLPQVARRMDRLSVLRSLSSTEGEHQRAQYLLHTGYALVDGFPRPSAGSVVSHESPASKMPGYVSIGSPGFGPAYLGEEHGPFSVDDPARALEILRKLERRRERLALTRDLGRAFDESHDSPLLDKRKAVVERIEGLLDTPFAKALDLSREPQESRAKYGEGGFAQGCLLARRLLEAGASFVEVHQDGWDTHQDNFAALRRLGGAIDRPWAALMDDLYGGGLLQDTVVLWMGEFGRTPTVNGDNGRDHYPLVTGAVVGGGGIAGGRVIGSTNAQGTRVEGAPVAVPDLLATLFTAVGVDPAKQFRTDFGGNAAATDNGRPIRELVE